MMNLIRWVKRLSGWVIEPRALWLCILMVVASLFLAFTGPVSEPKIRIVGLSLQLAGLTTVAWGLRETRKLFGYPSLFEHAVKWIRRFPKFNPKPITGVLNLSAVGNVGASGSGYSWHSLGPEASVEKRLAAAEANLLNVNWRLDEIYKQFHNETQKINSVLNKEQLLRKSEDETIRRKLELSQTGGLSISFMGLVWLLLGLLLSTASTEMVKFFN